MIWFVYPFFFGWFNFNYSLIFVLCVRGFSVFPLFLAGLSSNRKYAIIGSTRAVAQVISYEMRLMTILLRIFFFYGFSLSSIYMKQYLVINFFIFGYLSYVWGFSVLAERNRTPYDFSEGESELVSGFNTEYSGGGFLIFFLAEYSSLLFLSLLRVVIFLGYFGEYFLFLCALIYIYVFI